MRLSWTPLDRGTWRLRLRLDAEDTLFGPGEGGRMMELVTDTCHVTVPEGSPEPHPDLLALTAWTITSGWAKKRVTFDRPISPGLAEAIGTGWKIDAGPVDDALLPRLGRRMGLAYSSGVDSIAAAELMPDAALLHVRHARHPRLPNRRPRKRFDVIARLAGTARERGRDVGIVGSDLQCLVRAQPKNPQWTVVAIGAVMLADAYDLGAVGFGTVIETAYLGHGLRWTGRRGHASNWHRAFAAGGLPFVLPVGGMTEVATMRLAMGSPLRDLARSCSNGGSSGPCMACQKCLRKELLTAAIERRPVDARLAGLESKKTRPWRAAPPYHIHDGVEYAVARVPGLHDTIFADCAKHLAYATEESTAWTERYYRPNLEMQVPEPWRGELEKAIGGRMEFMSGAEEQIVETWDAAARG